VVRGGNIPTMTAPSSVFIFVFFTHLVGSLNIIFCIHSPSVFWGHSGIFYPDTIVFFGYRVTKKNTRLGGNTPKISKRIFTIPHTLALRVRDVYFWGAFSNFILYYTYLLYGLLDILAMLYFITHDGEIPCNK